MQIRTVENKQNEATIRLICKQDSHQMLSLLEQLGYPQTLEIIQTQIQAYSEQTNHIAFVAEKDNKLVGFIALGWLIFLHAPGRTCRILGLVVDEQYRNMGIGTLLLMHAEKWATEEKCKIIDLTSGLRRTKDGSHKFYQSLGYHNDGDYAKVYLRKEL